MDDKELLDFLLTDNIFVRLDTKQGKRKLKSHFLRKKTNESSKAKYETNHISNTTNDRDLSVDSLNQLPEVDSDMDEILQGLDELIIGKGSSAKKKTRKNSKKRGIRENKKPKITLIQPDNDFDELGSFPIVKFVKSTKKPKNINAKAFKNNTPEQDELKQSSKRGVLTKNNKKQGITKNKKQGKSSPSIMESDVSQKENKEMTKKTSSITSNKPDKNRKLKSKAKLKNKEKLKSKAKLFDLEGTMKKIDIKLAEEDKPTDKIPNTTRRRNKKNQRKEKKANNANDSNEKNVLRDNTTELKTSSFVENISKEVTQKN